MSTSAISSSSASTLLEELYKYDSQKKQSELDQLGKDLQSGNLSAAQSDFAALTGDSSTSASSTTTSTDPVVEDLITLGKDLTSGDTSGAEKAYTALKNDLKAQDSASSSSSSSSTSSTSAEAQELLKILEGLGASSSMVTSAYTTNSTSNS
jgi:hypothetical protein